MKIKKTISIILIIFSFVVFPFLVSAQTISNVSGSVIHGQNITISGLGFGVKNPAVPLYWKDYEDTTVDNTSVVQTQGGFYGVWGAHSSCYNLNIYGDPRPMFKNSSSVRWPGAPHQNSTKILGAGFVDSSYAGNNNCDHVSYTVCANVSSKTWYTLYYKRYSADWPAKPGPTGPDISAGRDIDIYNIFLNEGISSDSNQIQVSGSHYIKIMANDVLRLDNEKVLVTSRSGNTVNIQRGHLGTVVAAHNPGRIYMRGCGYNLKEGTAETTKGTGYNSPGHWQSTGTLKMGSSATFSWIPNGEGGGLHSCSNCSSNSGINIQGQDAREAWKHLEFVLKDTAPGWLKAYADNQKTYDCQCINTQSEFEGWAGPGEALGGVFISEDIVCIGYGAYSPRLFIPEQTPCIDMVSNRHQPDESWVYLDDIYVDTTFSRVMLADSQSYDSATIVEPQIPSAWNDGSVTAKVNLGKLPDSGTAYLFVFDSNNNHNAIGYPVTLGSSGGDTTPPAAPTGVSVS